MEENLISYETAKLAKDKGVKHPTLKLDLTACDIPQSLLQKWLREKHGKLVWIRPVPDGSDRWSVYVENNIGHHFITYYVYRDTYEDALEKGLYEALKLI